MSCGGKHDLANERLGGGMPVDMAMSAPKTVLSGKNSRNTAVVKASQADWEYLSEILEMDTDSSAFDEELKDDLRRALDNLTVTTPKKGKVEVKLSLQDWDILNETLMADADSSLYEPAERNRIGRVLSRLAITESTVARPAQEDDEDFESNVAFMQTLAGDAGNEPEWQPSDDPALTEMAAEAVRRGKVLHCQDGAGTTPAYPASSRRARRGLDEPTAPDKKEMWYDDATRQFQVGDVEFHLDGDYTAATRDQPAEYPAWEETGQHSRVRTYGSYKEAYEDLRGGKK